MKTTRIYLVAATVVALAQIGFLYSMIAGRAAILRDGQVVVLEVQPIDPRDLFRGDYVRLGYNISTIAEALLAEGTTGTAVPAGGAIFVQLAPDAQTGIWNATAAAFDRTLLDDTDDTVVMAGTLQSAFAGDAGTLWVDYGIERYYVPEGEGRAIEDGLGERTFLMHVAVGTGGAAQVKALYDNGTMLYAEPLY